MEILTCDLYHSWKGGVNTARRQLAYLHLLLPRKGVLGGRQTVGSSYLCETPDQLLSYCAKLSFATFQSEGSLSFTLR